ncbi:hypothetical protein PY650_00430 [Rhizobium calliandrae]|uniref:Intracellular septation protein A n=1 Tax=Rhizobium calliandrae TaxID=1312182 RepID=A0ABT7K6A4_9HYPH|nr:hypothetical protein [Rhizobium calliandrae]MDL2404144.1 hypothetical protein [Rhizobium calliandrae]
MGVLLAFLPFIVFAVADRFVGPTEALLLAALASFILLLRDWFILGKAPKILDIGTTVLFSGLAFYAALGGLMGSIFAVRLAVDSGLVAIVLISILIRRPFTLQYAREQVARELWDSPVFIRTNYVITSVWALAFAAMAAADAVLLYAPDVPAQVAIVATIVVVVAAIRFTGWYPEKIRRRSAER